MDYITGSLSVLANTPTLLVDDSTKDRYVYVAGSPGISIGFTSTTVAVANIGDGFVLPAGVELWVSVAGNTGDHSPVTFLVTKLPASISLCG